MLRVGGYPEIYIPPSERDLYLLTLKEGNNFNYIPLIDFVIHRMLRTFVYFISKTQQLLIDTMLTEFKEHFESSEEDGEVYPKFYKLLTNYYKSDELP